MKNKKEKATIDKVLRYIKRKTKTTEDGKEVVSRLHAELAAKMAFDGGRLNVLDNISWLKWKDVGQWVDTEGVASLICEADTPWGYCTIVYYYGPKTYEVQFNADILSDKCTSLTEAKRLAERDYKKRVFETLGINSEK